MTIKLLKILLVTIILLLANNVNAQQRIVYYTGSEGIIVKASFGQITEIQFDGIEIASIVMGMPVDTISMQNAGNILYIQPLVEDLSGDFFVVFKNGNSARLSLIPVPAEVRDVSIRVIYGVEQAVNRIKKIKESGLSPAGLIRLMMLEQVIDGVSVSKTDVVLFDAPFTGVATKVYDALFMKGYVIDIPSGIKDFDIRSLSAPGLVAGAVRGGKIYLVFFSKS